MVEPNRLSQVRAFTHTIMPNKYLSFAVLTAVSLLVTGCVTEPASPQDSAKYSIEDTGKFTHLDKATQAAVSCTNLQERRLPDGRLEVVASLRNRESRDLKVQINCVFKDEQGFTTGDETPFRTVALTEEATEAVRFTSANPAARKYTLRVRLAR